MPAFCRCLLNACRRPKPSPPGQNYTDPNVNTDNRVETWTSPNLAATVVTNDENQNNAQTVVNNEPEVDPIPNGEDQTPVRPMVIALPGPGCSVPQNRSCPPMDIVLELEDIDSSSTITENSDINWLDKVNSNMRIVSGGSFDEASEG